MRIRFESKGNFNNAMSWLKQKSTQNPSRVLSPIAKQGTRSLAAGTPRDTGATASGWVEEITTKGDVTEIVWKNVAHPGTSVNIAKIIDLGHGTGTGGYVPPRPYIKQSMKPVWSSADRALKGWFK